MFKLSWIFGRKKDNPACSESAPEKVARIPQHDPLDPMIQLGKIRGWNVKPEKAPVIRSVKDSLEPGLSVAMDNAHGDGPTPAAKAAAGGQNPHVSTEQSCSWYNSQGFIGYQACAIISQHWLVDKAYSRCQAKTQRGTDGNSSRMAGSCLMSKAR
ncbi:minor head protein [Pseudomonas phage WP1]